jgi:hypothetical protein
VFFSEEKNQKTFKSAPLERYQDLVGKRALDAEVFIGACAQRGYCHFAQVSQTTTCVSPGKRKPKKFFCCF